MLKLRMTELYKYLYSSHISPWCGAYLSTRTTSSLMRSALFWDITRRRVVIVYRQERGSHQHRGGSLKSNFVIWLYMGYGILFTCNFASVMLSDTLKVIHIHIRAARFNAWHFEIFNHLKIRNYTDGSHGLNCFRTETSCWFYCDGDELQDPHNHRVSLLAFYVVTHK
jgi:hypothetical protein